MNNKLKEILVSLLAKGATALAKLLKSKLLSKAEEKYCKALQITADKITTKTADRITALAKETDVKKRARALYLLKLMESTLSTVALSLTETANYITFHVDFTEIDEPAEEVLVALAEIPGAFDSDDDHCGPDGCTFA